MPASLFTTDGWLHRLRRIALPSLCAVCHGVGEGRICGDCMQRYAPMRPRCARCALPLPDGVPRCAPCDRSAPPFSRAVAACDFAFPWSQLLQSAKSPNHVDLAPALAAMLGDAVLRQRASIDSALPDGGIAGPIQALVVPMPASLERMRQRGFNPAWEIARRVARRWRWPASSQVLVRRIDTPSQRGLAPAARRANVRGAFSVGAAQRAQLQGRCVVLVDDVMTTGASAAEASGALLHAGAARVDVWVVARTPQPGT